MDFEAWLATLNAWASGPVRREKLHRTKLKGLTGIIAVRFNNKSGSITSAYLIHHDEFDKLLYGRAANAGMLISHCGFILPPHLSAYAYPENPESIRRLQAIILGEAPIFFEALDGLGKVHAELTAQNPKFEHADPRGPQLRQMHAAVVAFLLGLDWREHIEAAYRIKFHLGNDRLDVVFARLEAAEAERKGNQHS